MIFQSEYSTGRAPKDNVATNQRMHYDAASSDFVCKARVQVAAHVRIQAYFGLVAQLSSWQDEHEQKEQGEGEAVRRDLPYRTAWIAYVIYIHPTHSIFPYF